MARDIQELKLARLASGPKEQSAKLHWQRFCGLSQSVERIVGQEQQLSKLVGMVADSSNQRSVYLIVGTPGMVCYDPMDVVELAYCPRWQEAVLCVSLHGMTLLGRTAPQCIAIVCC